MCADIRRRPPAGTCAAICACLLAFACTAALAATPAGTIIRNQASASFLGSDGRRVSVTSNLVETRVAAVAGLELVTSRTQRAAAGATVDLPHTVRNTGNGDDVYALAAVNLGADNLDLDAIEIHPDADGDGIADAGGPIVATPVIVAGGSFDIVVRARMPDAATDGSVARVEVRATSALDAGLSEVDVDTVTAGAGATVTVTKRLSARTGAAASGPYRVTLSWENVGDGVAGDLVLIDALPDGMRYVPGSGAWSGGGSAPTDADPSDTHPGGAATLRWCAYHPSCTGLPEAALDADADPANQVTAIIDYVPPGSGGTVSFDVEIPAGTAPGPLVNTAEFEHDVAIVTVARARSNAVTFRVLGTPGVVANGTEATPTPNMAEPVTRTSAVAGTAVRFDNIVWNTGDALDTFDIEVDGASATFPAGTPWRLLRSDGATPLLDTDGNGRVDTGPIRPGASARVVLELVLPPGASGTNGGLGFDIEKVARSATDSSVSDPVVDHLDEIVGAGVDLTNAAPAGTADATGEGAGPETDAVTTVAVDDAGEARFALFVNHLAGPATAYALGARSPTPRGDPPLALPSGWRVRFEDPATGTALTATPILAAGESAAVEAIVTVPADAPAGIVPVHFSASSTDGAVRDLKHDAVTVGSRGTLAFTPDHTGQVEPGGSIVYAHRVASAANLAVDDLEFETDAGADGWSVTLWDDADGDGALGPGDARVTGPWRLAAGEDRLLFARVFAPSEAPVGAVNATVITARWNAGADALAVTDRTGTARTNVRIRKLQATDVGCDGVPDPGTDFGTAAIEIAPGDNCVIYRLEASNVGTEISYNVSILDYTPPWTVYHPGAACSTSPCWIEVPAVGEAGTLSADTDALAPGESYFLEFSVRVR